MKQFNGPRPRNEITKNLKKYGFFLDTTRYDGGSDYLDYNLGHILGQPVMLLMVSPWNGCFIAIDFHKVILATERSDLDGTPWYDAILEAIYLPLPEKNATANKSDAPEEAV